MRVQSCGDRNTDEALLIVSRENWTGLDWPAGSEKKRPSAKVILTGTVANEAKEAADLCEEGPVLSKPYDPQLLVDRIKRALATRDRIKLWSTISDRRA
jgi:hypothetical protein